MPLNLRYFTLGWLFSFARYVFWPLTMEVHLKLTPCVEMSKGHSWFAQLGDATTGSTGQGSPAAAAPSMHCSVSKGQIHSMLR